MVTDVGQCALDAIVTPGRILFGEPQDQVHDHLANAWSAHWLALLTVVPLVCHEFAVLTKNCIRCHDGRQLPQCLAPESLAFDGQQPALVVGE